MSEVPVFTYKGEYDENWPLPERLTSEQYQKVIFRPDAHFVDGVIIPRVLGDMTHAQTVGALIMQLSAPCQSIGAPCCVSLRLRISSTRVRVCDLTVLQPGSPY